MVKVSIIVPVYNTYSYLDECLMSILKQQIKDIEIICINDGSTDKSIDILHNYEKKYDNIKVINQKNQGLSFTRNIGINIANGKYILFLDSDDYLLYKNALILLYEYSEKYNNDLILFNFTRNNDYLNYDKIIKDEENKFNIIKKVLSFEHTSSSCTLFISKLLIKKSKFKFPVGKLYEDTASVYKLLFLTKNPLLIVNIFYFYRQRNNSITKTINKKTIDDIFSSIYCCISDVSSYKNELQPFIQGRISSLINGCLINIREKNCKKLLDYLLHQINKLNNYYSISKSTLFYWNSFLVSNFYFYNELLLSKSRIYQLKFNKFLKIYNSSFSRIFCNSISRFEKNSIFIWGDNKYTKKITNYSNANNIDIIILDTSSSNIKYSLSYNSIIIIVSLSSSFIIKEKINDMFSDTLSKPKVFDFYDLIP